MDRIARISNIQKLIDNPENQTGEIRIVNYDGQPIPLPVYNIPLEYLVYNVLNGRIRSLIKSHEMKFGSLTPENHEDSNVIERFLFDSAIGKNEKTLESIESIGQQESGIVTIDGVVIDGNRRSMLIRKINRKNRSNLKFKAVILSSELSGNERELMKLETSYQMGVDSKVDYNPIEKYIRCEELTNYFTIQEIAELMTESESQINKWLDILNLMKEYLNFLGSPSLFTRLEKKEGHFVDLIKYLSALDRGNNENVEWRYDRTDIEKLKTAYFTYIRLGNPVQSTREIGRPTLKRSFFCHSDIWPEFSEELEKAINVEEKSIEELLRTASDDQSIDDIIEVLDKNWTNKVEEPLNKIFSYYSSILNEKVADLEPKRLLQRAKRTLQNIDLQKLSVAKAQDSEIPILIKELQNLVSTF